MSDTTEKLNDLLPLSPDHNTERLAELKRLFPDLFTNEGRLNVDELKKVVDPALVSETERYDFRWYGKTASKRDAFTPSRAALVYDESRSVNPEKAGGNMIIEGENLEVLKLLTSAYRERIKCIYIDPPYNTGKDFVYTDRFAEGQKPYWEQTGVTEDGVRVDTNTESDGRFHSNWLSMMHSRLLIARRLLTFDGVIFVSIDDHEAQNLRRIMDEVFGEENFVAQFVWQKRVSPDNDEKHVTATHEYVICFMRSKDDYAINGFNRSSIQDERYENPDNDPRGPWTSSDLTRREYREHDFYEIELPSGRKVTPAAGRSWGLPPESFTKLKNDHRIWFGPNGDSMPRLKRFLSEVSNKIVPVTWLAREFSGTNQDGKRLVNALFPELANVFDNPKPSTLISTLVKMTTGPDDLILDFFAGSGTTGQSIIELNKENNGIRTFILVQLPEIVAVDSPAYRENFKKISDITIERNKRVIANLQNDAKDLLPGDSQRQFADSLGFKVFKLAKSSFPRVEFAPDPDKTEAENVELLKQYIQNKEASFHIQWERDTIIDEVLLKCGFMLDYTLTPCPEFKKNEVVLVKDVHRESLLCLDTIIDSETVDYFKKHKDRFFICLELALDTTKKWNLKHHLGDKFKAF